MLRFNGVHVVLLSFVIIALVYYVGVRNGFKHRDEDGKDADDDYQISDIKQGFLDDKDDHLVWFIHISDLHISIFHNKDIVKDLEYFIKNVLAVVKPKVVIVTGDLTDGKYDNMRSTTQFEQEWKIYSQLIKDNRVLENTVWLDVRGNHDNFDVLGKDSETNLFKKYGVMRKNDHFYIYKLNMTNGDQYSFIGIDACTDPGPKAPFNFFGHLSPKDIELLKKYDESSKSSNATIWFGHFPTSIIYSPREVRDAMSNGAAYLSGHLHTFGDMLPSMYSRQSNGMLELELSDWKFNRKFRILAFDAGLLSFQDFKLSTTNKSTHNILILITNPKNVLFKTTNNREPLRRSRHSSHIRFLVFSQRPVASARVLIDNVDLGEAVAFDASSSPLYVLKWNPFDYRKGVHRLRVIVEDADGFVKTASHEFALDDTVKPFSGLANFVLTYDQSFYMSAFFWVAFFGNLAILTFFRFVRRRFTVHFISCNPFRTLILRYLRRFSLLSSIDYIYWSLIGLLIYVPFCPWFLAEIFSNQYGIVFRWGILVEDYYIQPDIQNLAAFLHMISFQFFLMFHLSYQIEHRFIHLDFNPNMNNRLTNTRICTESKSIVLIPFRLVKYLVLATLRNISFILLWFSAIWNLKDLFLCYSYIAILICPLKLWMPLVAVYLRHKCANLTVADFDCFIDTSKLRSAAASLNHGDQILLDDQEAKRLLNSNSSSASSSAFKES